VRLLILAAAAAGCSFSPPEGGGTFVCSAAAPECPPGTMCIDDRCLVAGADAAELPTGFRFRQKLTFDNRRGTVAGFPLLVALDPRVFDYPDAADDGSDLRFYDVDDTPLPHEIEEWNPSGRSILWVRVPEVTGNSNQDYIWLYYGNQDPPAPPALDVWSAYQAVFHLGASADDSGSLMLEGVESGTLAAPGRIGQGRRFNGTSDHITVGPEPPVLRGVAGMSLEAWVYRDQPLVDTDQVVIAATAHGADFSRAQIKLDPTGAVRATFRTQDAAAPNAVYTLASELPVGEWTWVAVTMDLAEQEMRIALNGNQSVGVSNVDLDPQTAETNPDQLLIGRDETGGEWFAGALDELRIAGTAASEDWLSLQYASMTESLVELGAPEAL